MRSYGSGFNGLTDCDYRRLGMAICTSIPTLLTAREKAWTCFNSWLWNRENTLAGYDLERVRYIQYAIDCAENDYTYSI